MVLDQLDKFDAAILTELLSSNLRNDAMATGAESKSVTGDT